MPEELSLARVRRPTDNAIIAKVLRHYQEGRNLRCFSYPDHQSAMEEIGNYIDYYNEERHHQAIWNFAPSHVHEAKSKSVVPPELEAIKFQKKFRRREYWSMKETIDMQNKLRESLTGTASRDITLT